ncbi:GntR family transcriptional regulator [Ammoniphilus sp. 3BR4]|uniref:GntR family transcriptional regulator n=1 Tax=Ammoniphilus sp. 3BR4 TaxID=3158265 RepID=UPI003465A82B
MSKLDLRLNKTELETVHTKVTRVLREAILRGDIAPGERLIQEELANSLGVSRMPVREALRKLEIEGLITIEPHRGAIVKSLKVEDIEEIYELRSQFEKMAVEQSAKSLGSDEIAQLERLIIQMDQAKEAEEFVEANIQFHNILMSHCSWKRLVFFIETLWNGFPQQTPHILTEHTKKSNQEHKDILEAVKQGDSQKAAELVSIHISRTGKELVEKIKTNRDV